MKLTRREFIKTNAIAATAAAAGINIPGASATMAQKKDVITSYSIHYTKLYDFATTMIYSAILCGIGAVIGKALSIRSVRS